VSYNAYNTTCLCDIDGIPSDDSRRLQSSVTQLDEFSASASLVVDSFASTVVSIKDLSFSDLANNIVILVFTSVVTLVTIIGTCFMIGKDRDELKLSETVKHPTNRELGTALDSIVPAEVASVPPTKRLWNVLKNAHEAFACLGPYNPKGDYRAAKFLCGMGLLINFMFVDTILAVLFFNDDGTCEAHTSFESCEQIRSLDQFNTLCEWDSEAETCAFNENVGADAIPNLILAATIAIVAIPFQLFFNWMVNHCRNFFAVRYLQKEFENNQEDGFAPELKGYETLRGTMLRAARLVKMQESMDIVSPEEEVSILKKKIDDDMGKMSIANAVAALKIKAENANAKRDSTGGPRNSVRNSFLWGSKRNSAVGGAVGVVDGDDNGDNLGEEVMNPVLPLRRKSSLLAPLNLAEVVAASTRHSHHVDEFTPEAVLLQQVYTSRVEAEKIVGNMDRMHSDADRGKYLLQCFSTNMFVGFQRNIAARVFQDPDTKGDHSLLHISWVTYMCLVLLPAYTIFLLLYIFLFGVGLGAKSTNSWLIGASVAFIQELLLLLPVKIFMSKVIVPSVIVKDLEHIHAGLDHRSKLIIMRSKGVLTHSNDRVQHLNPACRAARKYPHLTVSRLLISINDSDLEPMKEEQTQTRSNAARNVASFALIASLIGLTVMPEVFQEALIEVIVSGFCVAIVIIIAFLSTWSVAIPFGLLGLIAVVLVCRWMYYRDNKKKIRVVDSDKSDAEAEGNGVLDKIVSYEEGMKIDYNWKKTWKKSKSPAPSTADGDREPSLDGVGGGGAGSGWNILGTIYDTVLGSPGKKEAIGIDTNYDEDGSPSGEGIPSPLRLIYRGTQAREGNYRPSDARRSTINRRYMSRHGTALMGESSVDPLGSSDSDKLSMDMLDASWLAGDDVVLNDLADSRTSLKGSQSDMLSRLAGSEKASTVVSPSDDKPRKLRNMGNTYKRRMSAEFMKENPNFDPIAEGARLNDLILKGKPIVQTITSPNKGLALDTSPIGNGNGTTGVRAISSPLYSSLDEFSPTNTARGKKRFGGSIDEGDSGKELFSMLNDIFDEEVFVKPNDVRVNPNPQPNPGSSKVPPPDSMQPAGKAE
jgi:hypothetical protein